MASNLKASSHYWILFAAFFIFLWLRVPAARHSPYYFDDFYNFRDTQKISSRPLAPFFETISKEPRRHPFFSYLFFLEHKAFALDLSGYYTLLFLFHCLNSLLVTRLARSLGADPEAALFSGLLFLFSSAFYSILIILSSTPYTTCLFFFILAFLAWIDFIERRQTSAFIKSCLFQTLSLLNCEVAFVLPLLAIEAVFLLGRKELRPAVLKYYWPVLALLNVLVFLYLLSDFFISPRKQWLSVHGALNIIPKFLSLLKMFFQPLFIPDKGFLPIPGPWENAFRLAPLWIAAFILIFFLRGKKKAPLLEPANTPLIRMACGWIIITVLPYLGTSATFEHTTRYMYFPMVGFSLIFGVFAAGFFKTMRSANSRGGIFWGLVLLGYVLALNAAGTSYHFERYKRYMLENPENDCREKILALFNPRASAASSPGSTRTPA